MRTRLEPRLLTGATLFTALLTSSLASAQAARLLFTHTAPTIGAGFGTSIVDMGDLDGDSLDDYAIGAPTSSTGGTNAGEVAMFRGSNHAALWTASVVGTPGDLLGASLCRVPDFTGDGVDDLVIGAPGPGAPTPGPGRIVFVDGVSGAVVVLPGLASFSTNMGLAMCSLGSDIDGDSKPELVVLESAFADVFLSTGLSGGSAGGVIPVALPGPANSCAGAPGFLGSGLIAHAIAVGDSTTDTVSFLPVIASAPPKVVTGTPGDLFGTSLLFDPVTGHELVGAPAAAGGGGIVFDIAPTLSTTVRGIGGTLNGVTVIGVGGSLALGDIDNDGGEDIIAGGAANARVFLSDGTVQSPVGSGAGIPSTTNVSGIALLPKTGLGVGSIALGNNVAPGGGTVDILDGGATKKATTIGPGASPNSFVPQLSMTLLLQPGSFFVLQLANGVPATDSLLVGFPNSAGSALPSPFVAGATLWMSSPITMQTKNSDSNGNTLFISSIPLNLSFVGTHLAFQGVAALAGFSALGVTNGLDAVVGW